MALLEVLAEEDLGEDNVQQYFHNLYRIVCVGERPASRDYPGGAVRTTYVVDWEQLVHLLEDYTVFGEDIVEVAPLSGEEARVMQAGLRSAGQIARA
jgi:hypothetical protein